MKPITRPDCISAYLLMKLEAGKFTIVTTDLTEFGDLGAGCYSDLKKVQYQQTILALKNIQTEIYELEWPL